MYSEERSSLVRPLHGLKHNSSVEFQKDTLLQ